MSQEISGHTPDPIAALATLQAAHTAQIQALTAQRDDLLAALELAVREMRAVRDGSTGGIPNDIIALLPEAIEMADAAIAKARA